MELDKDAVYEKFDPEDVGFGIEKLPEQVRIAWHDTREISVPKSYANVSQIVIVGMGGSALGPFMLKSVFADRFQVPVEIVRDYTLPSYVGRKTLVILSSYSGNTEEVLSAHAAAKKAKAKIMVVAAGGKLAALGKAEKVPMYIFHPGELAKQPRYGIGFSFIGIMGLLERAGLLKVKESEPLKMMAAMGEVIDNCAVDVPAEENPAKQVAIALQKRNLFVIAAEHLAGNANAMNNQINENAKQLSHYLLLPELNHHVLESLVFPANTVSESAVFLMKSEHYHERTKKRCDITADIFEKRGVPVIEYLAKGETRLEEVGEVLQFGSYVAWYLAMVNHVITTDISVTEGFKKKLTK